MFLLMEAMNIVQTGKKRNFSKCVKNLMAYIVIKNTWLDIGEKLSNLKH